MFYSGVSHVIFSPHLGVGHSVLCQMGGVGQVFSNHHIFKCFCPPHLTPMYFLTSPYDCLFDTKIVRSSDPISSQILRF